jgi:hypothetical protein
MWSLQRLIGCPSRALRGREMPPSSLRTARASYDVRRILEPNGLSIERAELDEHYDKAASLACACRDDHRRVLRWVSGLLGWRQVGVGEPVTDGFHQDFLNSVSR